MHTLRPRQGFALPMALLVMVVLTAGLTAGFTSTSAEVITNAAYRGDNRAYNLAQAGLEQFLARRKEATICPVKTVAGAAGCLEDPSIATTDSETTRIVMDAGYADITALQVRHWVSDDLPALWYITSTGVDQTAKLTGATSAVSAKRSVAVYAVWSKAVVDVQGAWFALSGLHKDGAAGRIDGADECTAAQGGGKATLPGAVVPAGYFSGKTDAFYGDPKLDTSKTFEEVKAGVKLDWAGILAGSIAADFEVPPDAFPGTPASPFPTYFTTYPDEWPVIRVHTNDFSLPVAGRGMIIADGDFRITGSNMWDGIVLIGGKLVSKGNNTTAGATLSGLNYLLGTEVPPSEDDDSEAEGQKTYTYNSCNVTKASTGIRSYKAMSNTWTDAVPVW